MSYLVKPLDLSDSIVSTSESNLLVSMLSIDKSRHGSSIFSNDSYTDQLKSLPMPRSRYLPVKQTRQRFAAGISSVFEV